MPGLDYIYSEARAILAETDDKAGIKVTQENKYSNDYQFKGCIFAAIFLCTGFKNTPEKIVPSLTELLEIQGFKSLELDPLVEDLVELGVLEKSDNKVNAVLSQQELSEKFPSLLEELSKKVSGNLEFQQPRDLCTMQFFVITGSVSRPRKNSLGYGAPTQTTLKRFHGSLIKSDLFVSLPGSAQSARIGDTGALEVTGQQKYYPLSADSANLGLSPDEKRERVDKILEAHFDGKIGDGNRQFSQDVYDAVRSKVYSEAGIIDTKEAYEKYVEMCKEMEDLVGVADLESLKETADAEIRNDLIPSHEAALIDQRLQAKEILQMYNDFKRSNALQPVIEHVKKFTAQEKNKINVPDTLRLHASVGLT